MTFGALAVTRMVSFWAATTHTSRYRGVRENGTGPLNRSMKMPASTLNIWIEVSMSAPVWLVPRIVLTSAVVPAGTTKSWKFGDAVAFQARRTADLTVMSDDQVFGELRSNSSERRGRSGTSLAQAFRRHDRMRYAVGPFELPLSDDAGPEIRGDTRDAGCPTCAVFVDTGDDAR